MFIRGFGSDNHSPAHPEIIKAILTQQEGHQPSYGTDPVTQEAIKKFRLHFGPTCEVYFVFNGTSANVLSLKAFAESYHSVFCSDISHLNVDECASPEIVGHVKLWPLPSVDGKIQLQDLKESLIRRGDQHFSQQSLISLTQPTEYGTVYSIQELKEISEWAHSHGLKVHIDGARLCNAAVFLQKNLKELITDLKVDAVSFGGTKNGFLFGEAVLVFDSGLNQKLKYLRKQIGQLPSKTRYIAAQFDRYLSDNLWQKIAEHSLRMAQLLNQKLSEIPQIKITRPTQSNAVFAIIPQSVIKKLREEYFFYIWNENTFECRLMTSWDTQEYEILDFIQKIKEHL